MSALPLSSRDPASTAAPEDVATLDARLEAMDATARVRWALQHLPGTHVLSSSFGAQSAVTLHLLSRQQPDIPVILIDTGYLFPETYRFADTLTERLGLNLKVYRPLVSRAWMEARHGRLWEQGLVGIEQYNNLRKVEPMKRALDELQAATWFTGLRRSQSAGRAATPVLQRRDARWKVNPIAGCSDRGGHAGVLEVHRIDEIARRESVEVGAVDQHRLRRERFELGDDRAQRGGIRGHDG